MVANIWGINSFYGNYNCFNAGNFMMYANTNAYINSLFQSYQTYPCYTTPYFTCFNYNAYNNMYNPAISSYPVYNNYSNYTNFNNFYSNTTNPFLSLTSRSNIDKSISSRSNTCENSKKFSSNKTNINYKYTGTAEDLNKKLANRGVLAGKGAVFLKAQEQYGINAAFLASICIQESGGKSDLARNKNNVGGVRGKDCWKSFSSVDECIMYMASFLKKGYLDKGLTTIEQVGAKYCPVNDLKDKKGTNNRWAGHVTQVYNSIA